MTRQKKIKRRKKIVRKSSSQKGAGVMAIVPYSEIVKPEVYKGKNSLIASPFTELQIKAILAPTPQEIIKKRPGKGGGQWDYVPGWWFKKKLNFVFGFAHDFEILGERVDGDYITVKGRLIVKDPRSGKELSHKDDYGGAAVKYLRDKAHTPANYLDISNDFKAAATDALKRCAVQLGFAMDVYGSNELVNEGYEVTNGNPPSNRVQEAKKVKVTVTSPANNGVDYLKQVKQRLFDLGARNEKAALAFLKSRTGLVWKNFKVEQKEAQKALAALIIKGK